MPDTPDAKAEIVLPASVELLRPFGYYTEDKQLRQWPAGAVVTNRKEIADLIRRKAPVKG
jgi:hypothetical protein